MSNTLQDDALRVINETIEKYSEYLEMVKNPDTFMIGVMALKIAKLEGHIDYLERRLQT